MYSRSELQRKAEKKARVAQQLAEAKLGAEARAKRAENSGSNNTISLAPDVPNTPAIPPPFKYTMGRTMQSAVNLANKRKMAVYNDPVDGSSLKRKANGHADAPAPKKANTHIYIPRAPGERYQGTAARPPPNSHRIFRVKRVTQQKARDNNAMDGHAPSTPRKSKKAQQQGPKDATAMELDLSSSLGRKRDADHDLNESAAKKHRPNAFPSSGLGLTQSPKAGKALPTTSKPAPKTKYVDSLYPKDSKLRASARRAVITTEIVRTAAPSPAVQATNVEHTAPTTATPIVGKSKLPTPRKGSKKDGQITDHRLEKTSVSVSSQTSPVSHQGHNAATKGNEKSLKRKDTTFEEGTEHKKRRRGDGNASLSKEHNSSKIEATCQDSGERTPSAGTFDHIPLANGIPVAECKEPPSKGNNKNESCEDAESSVVGHDDPNAKNGGPAARGAKPRGIYNEARACYINSVVQAIANIPRIANHYRTLADKVIPEVAEYIALNAECWEGGDTTTRSNSKAREKLKVLLETNKSQICLGAYLGVLLNEMLDVDPSAETPSSYVFRQACGILLANDRHQRYDGEKEQECMEYLEKLLDHLGMEELVARTEDFGAPSLVRELFGLEAVPNFKCLACSHAWQSSPEQKFAFTTGMPRHESTTSTRDPENSVCITECLDAYSNPDPVVVDCDGCGKNREALKWMQLKDLSPYVLVNIDRVVGHESEHEKETTFTKNLDTISLPASGAVTIKDGAENVGYEAIGTLKHEGKGFDNGHWTSWMKIDGQWWYFDDHRVAKNEVERSRTRVTSTVVLKRSA